MTYSLGFFLGPGLPRGLGMPSTVKPIFRFVPGARSFFFLVGSPELAASEAGTGVELDSEAASADSVTFRIGTPLLVAMGVLAA
jgi:hypothetical protein